MGYGGITIDILCPMNQPRTLLLFDPGARPQGWNECMKPGEYAILYSSLQLGSDPVHSAAMREPICSVFTTLAEAEEYAAQQVALMPTLGCRIFDHDGLGRQPIREIRGVEYKGEEEITPRFRRWWGYSLFLGGMVLLVVDWHADFGLLWPAMFATRMVPVCLLLLVTELVIYIEAKRKKGREERSTLEPKRSGHRKQPVSWRRRAQGYARWYFSLRTGSAGAIPTKRSGVSCRRKANRLGLSRTLLYP
jgi:hypothetical protein